MSLNDPGPAPEPTGEGGPRMKAKDLKNKPCIFRPTGTGEWPATADKAASAFVSCDVWVLDRQGVVEQGTGVRVGWWRAQEQLKSQMGQFVGAKPVEQEDNSIILTPLSEAARAVAAQVVEEIESGSTPPPPDDDSAPF